MRGSIGVTLALVLSAPALALAAPAFAQSTSKQAAPVLRDIRFKLFGTVQPDGSRGVHEIESGGAIPNLPEASCYTWVLNFAPVAGEVAIEELLELPASAPNWNALGRTQVSEDRKSGRTALIVDGGAGEARNGWCVAEDDPEGRYRFTISSAGAVVARITFFVGQYF
jgi:hypothetical protein